MSTLTEPTLEQLETQLLEIDPTLRGQTLRPVQLPHTLQALEKVNATLKQANAAFFTQARALYNSLAEDDTSLARLKTNLDQQLQTLDETSRVDGQGRKAYMTYTAGSTALEQEARLNAKDYLLTPSDQRMVEDCSRGPAFRPGMYALTFTYQEQTVAFAGAFVLTRQASPVVNDLTSGEPVGPVLLFTPSRGLEPFVSLHDLDQGLLTIMATATDRDVLTRHLPVAYQHLDSAVSGPWNCNRSPTSRCSNSATRRCWTNAASTSRPPWRTTRLPRGFHCWTPPFRRRCPTSPNAWNFAPNACWNKPSTTVCPSGSAMPQRLTNTR